MVGCGAYAILTRDRDPGAGAVTTAAELADFDPDALAAIFAERPTPHRYPKAKDS